MTLGRRGKVTAMNGKGENRTSLWNNHAAWVIILYIFLGGIFAGVWTFSKGENWSFNNESAQIVSREFEVTYGTETVSTALPAQLDTQGVRMMTVMGKLSTKELTGDTLAFYVYNSYVSVYVNDNLTIDSYISDENPILAPPSRWYMVTIPQDCTEVDIKIEITPFFDRYMGQLPTVYTGSKASIMYMIGSRGIFGFGVGTVTLVIGGVLFLLGLLIRSEEYVKRLRWFGILAFTAGVWITLCAGLSQFFVGKTMVVSFIGHMSFFMLPILLQGFLLTCDSCSSHRYMNWLFKACFGAVVLIYMLQIFKLEYYQNMLWVGHVLFLLIIAGVIGCYIDAMRMKIKPHEDIAIYRVVMLISLFMLMDIVRFYIDDSATDDMKYSRIGMLCLICYMGFSTIKMICLNRINREKTRFYKEVAFHDIMTKLENRSAYEVKIRELRDRKVPENTTIVVADLNNLKMINDTYGHHKGDEAIMRVGEILKNSFPETSNCYRIGGDEFCVISVGVKPEIIEQSRMRMIELIERYGKNTEYPLSVASSMCVADGMSIDECFNKADAAMYEEKRRIKKERGLQNN